MERRRLNTLVGLAMVGVGALQTGVYALQSEWTPAALGVLYAVVGVAYLWVHVYTAGQ
ncbi:uncharacterized protein HHUB_2414 [Halobacterium hubeiense]|uniref:Uncharacterized protein n=2 Tax=Halobacterium TaxID=2239 RepID=A0A0U5AEJ6_9EURY|nr:hypothetical protein [Halobacterium hubeiense]CQH56664.1 uncharacterized protein HHUB_2414 [Halobacterium hubeiense]